MYKNGLMEGQGILYDKISGKKVFEGILKDGFIYDGHTFEEVS
jgi:hypothetical protein